MNPWKETRRRAKRAGADIPALFLEVFGASYAGQVTSERARQSIIEACDEMLERSQPEKRSNMEQILKDILAESQKTNELLLRLINGGEVAPKKVKAPKVTEEYKPVVQSDGSTKLVEQPKVADVTPEALRAIATIYSKKFGMQILHAELLLQEVRHGGSAEAEREVRREEAVRCAAREPRVPRCGDAGPDRS
jgi:hypothetical protein